MNTIEELKILYRFDKLRFINAIKTIKKNPAIIGATIFIIIQILFLASLLNDLRDSSVYFNINSFYHGIYFYIILITLISFLFGLFLISIYKFEIDFLLPKPISKKSILLRKIIMAYFILIIINIFICGLFYYIFKDTNLLNYIHYFKILFGGITLAFIVLNVVIIINHYYRSLTNNTLKNIFVGLMYIVFFICIYELLYIIYEGVFLEKINTQILQIIKLTPLNIVFIIPFSALYIIISTNYDFYYFLALIFSSSLFIVSTIIVFDLKLTYFEDFGFAAAPTEMIHEREIPPEMQWWRKGYFKKLKGHYPILKEGAGSILEIGFLLRRRYLFYMLVPGLIAIIILITISSLIFNKNIPFIIYFLFCIFYIFILLIFDVVFQVSNKEYSSLFALPIDGYKLAIFKFIPSFSYIVPTFLCILLIALLDQILTDLEHLLIISTMGIIIISSLIISQISGFLYFSSENNLTSSNLLETGMMGSVIALTLTIFFNRWLYWIISLFVDNIWKFLFIALANIGFFLIYLHLFANDFNNWGKKRRRRGIRIFCAIFISIIFVISVKGYPISDLVEKHFIPWSYDETPESWALRVDDELIIENQIIFYDDHIYITSSGELSIINSKIFFKCSKENIFGIYLSKGGKLNIKNSTLTTKFYRYGAKYNLYGQAKISDSEFINLRGGNYHGQEFGGVRVYSSNVDLINTQVRNGYATGIQVIDSQPRFVNITVDGCSVDGIQLYNSDAFIVDSTFEYNRIDGIYVVRSGPTIENCILRNNGQYGIHIYDGDPFLKNNIYENNTKDDIYYYESN